MLKNKKTDSSDSTRLEVFINRILEAEKRRHPLRCTGRLLHVLSGKRFGIPSGGGYVRLDAKDSGTDTKLIMNALWRHFWSALPDITSLYENGLEVPDEPISEALDEHHGAETFLPVYTQPILMLPPPSAPEYIPEVEAEIVEIEPVSEFNAEEQAMQAVTDADSALEYFRGDHPRWAEPVSLLNAIEATLQSASVCHPDKDSLYERLAFVRNCYRYLEYFEEDFRQLLNSQNNPDDIWGVPWLARGAQDLFNQQIMPTPEELCRASLPHYLVEKWQCTTTEDDKPNTETDNYPSVKNSNETFRQPAPEQDTGF